MFKDRTNMSHYLLKAMDDYQKAFELTNNPEYLKMKDELVNKFNNAKVSKDNL